MPKRAIKASATKDRLAAIIEKQIPAAERISLAAKLARGAQLVRIEKTGSKKGEEVIFSAKPDMDAIRFLEEYATGKPVQRQEVKLDDGFACIIVPPVAQTVDIARLREIRAKAAKVE